MLTFELKYLYELLAYNIRAIPDDKYVRACVCLRNLVSYNINKLFNIQVLIMGTIYTESIWFVVQTCVCHSVAMSVWPQSMKFLRQLWYQQQNVLFYQQNNIFFTLNIFAANFHDFVGMIWENTIYQVPDTW